MTNHDSNPYPNGSAPKPIAYVKTARRDGKFVVIFSFPISGRQITKILTRAEIAALSDRYTVSGVAR